MDAGDPPPPPSSEQPSQGELLQLIQDLNQCNDALLARITELEEALERSQAALQSEVERSQAQGPGGNPPRSNQVAQLLAELEIANDGLRRTTLHNEALQMELDASQQRVGQMEREYTLLQQRFNERSQALQHAEATCRDLRTRLHRQQRYTLQFKAALEKCLNMSSEQSVASLSASLQTQDSPVTNHPIAMPKAQQIQPWAADTEAAPTDPSLSHLLRGLKSVGQGPATHPSPTSPPSSPTATPTVPTADFLSSPPPSSPSSLDAETALWQELERVTSADPSDPMQASAPPPLPTPPPSIPAAASSPGFTEPSPWGSPLPNPAVASEPEAPVPTVADADLGPVIPAPEVIPPSQSPVVPPMVPPPVTTASPDTTAAQVPPPPEPAVRPSTAIPSFPDRSPQSSPSPVVYPLRAKKKLNSLAAVQLPDFSHRRKHG